jgi:LacI family transcriptional regulator
MPTAGEQLAEKLRAQIVTGAWTPGMRLPDRSVLAGELGACLATLQEAMTQLVDEGFLHVGARKHGTRVAAAPPHLSRYRLIFPFGPDDFGQFWHALEAAARERSTPSQALLPFYGLSGHCDIAEYQAVVHEVLTQQVAGLILASSADELRGTPLLDAPGLPRVAIADREQLPGIPKVTLDLDSFLDQAIEELLALGRRRLAVLCATHATGVAERFQQLLAARGLPVRRTFVQYASRRVPCTARQVTELLFAPAQPERPDGLIIADDNLLTEASIGLRFAGVRVPEELHLVAATNFPNLPPAALPLIRIGFDIPALLDLLILRLQQLIRKEAPPEFTVMPAITEAQFLTAHAPIGRTRAPAGDRV